MPDWLVYSVLIIYGLGMLFIFAYSIVQLQLLLAYIRTKKDRAIKVEPTELSALPFVLIQLPVFNEQYVVERLIDAVAQLDYPREKLEIQLLDDSTDESFEIGTRAVEKWKAAGIRIKQISRTNREGFKAGALKFGLELSLPPYVAIFDADFIPSPDFLKRTIPYFTDPEIGMVQSRWGHVNRHHSLLTQVQAFALDAHFTVEQGGRNASAHFINFNGTAGIWRRTCIESAGGWSADTLTEDLDLSYRAQLKGWKFKFLEGLVSPAELPAEMKALRTQQFRWNKGAAECAVKHLREVLFTAKLPISTRLHALFHLLNSSIFIWIVICAILSLPLVMIKEQHPELKILFYAGSSLIVAFIVLAGFYYTAYRHLKSENGKSNFLWLYPAFLSISMGMSLHNARSVLLGLGGKRTPFIRTPKWNITQSGGSFRGKRYTSNGISTIAWFELALGLYFSFSLAYEISISSWGFVPLHLMLIFGFATVCYYTFKHALGYR